MGILLNKQEQKRLFLIEELQKLGVSETKDGLSIHVLEYDDLKHELVMASFRKIDIETDSNRYF